MEQWDKEDTEDFEILSPKNIQENVSEAPENIKKKIREATVAIKNKLKSVQ